MALLIIDPSFQPEMAKLGLLSFAAIQKFFATPPELERGQLGRPAGETPAPQSKDRVAEGRVRGMRVSVKPHTLTLADGTALPVFFKQYEYTPPAWVFLGRRSKARCEFENYAALQRLGLPVAARVACGEERDALGRLRRAFIITRAVPSAQTLLEFVREHCPDRATAGAAALRDQLWQQLAAAARTMHAGDFFHHDFVWRNLLVNRAPDGTPQLWLIDCPRGGVRPWGRQRHRWKDLASLDKSAAQFCTRAERLNFLQLYLGESRVDGAVKKLAREVLEYRRHRWPEDWK